MKKILIPLLTALLFVACSSHKEKSEVHFITDEAYRNEVHQDFASRVKNYELNDLTLDTLSVQEREGASASTLSLHSDEPGKLAEAPRLPLGLFSGRPVEVRLDRVDASALIVEAWETRHCVVIRQEA